MSHRLRSAAVIACTFLVCRHSPAQMLQPLSNASIAEKTEPFYKAMEAGDWAKVNQYLAPELRAGGKFVYSMGWTGVQGTLGHALSKSIRMRTADVANGSAGEGMLCIWVFRNADSTSKRWQLKADAEEARHRATPPKPEEMEEVTVIERTPPVTRLDFWRIQKNGELVVIPEELMDSSGTHLSSHYDKVFQSGVFDSLEALNAHARKEAAIMDGIKERLQKMAKEKAKAWKGAQEKAELREAKRKATT